MSMNGKEPDTSELDSFTEASQMLDHALSEINGFIIEERVSKNSSESEKSPHILHYSPSGLSSLLRVAPKFTNFTNGVHSNGTSEPCYALPYKPGRRSSSGNCSPSLSARHDKTSDVVTSSARMVSNVVNNYTDSNSNIYSEYRMSSNGNGNNSNAQSLACQLASELRKTTYEKDFPAPPADAAIRNVILRWLANCLELSLDIENSDVNGNDTPRSSAFRKQNGTIKKQFFSPKSMNQETDADTALSESRISRGSSGEFSLDERRLSETILDANMSQFVRNAATNGHLQQANVQHPRPNYASMPQPLPVYYGGQPSSGNQGTFGASSTSSLDSQHNSMSSLRHVTPPSTVSRTTVIPYPGGGPKNYADYHRSKVSSMTGSGVAHGRQAMCREYASGAEPCCFTDSAYGSNMSTASSSGFSVTSSGGGGGSRMSNSPSFFSSFGSNVPAHVGLVPSGAQPTCSETYLPPPPYGKMTAHHTLAGPGVMMMQRNRHRNAHKIHRSHSDSKYPDVMTARHSWMGARSRSPSPSTSTVSCPEYGDIHDKLQRLETDRESLSLQVTILSEQVGAQTEKIRDLESLLADKKNKLDSTEEMLQEELMTRTTLETGKLDLLSEISALKMRFTALEKEKIETEQRFLSAQSEISQLQRMVTERNNEIVNVFPTARQLNGGSMDQANEVDQLRFAIQQLVAANKEKEEHISTLSRTLESQQLRLTNLGAGEANAYSLHHSRSGPSVGSNMVNPAATTAHSSQRLEPDINVKLRQLLLADESNGISNSTSYADSFIYQAMSRDVSGIAPHNSAQCGQSGTLPASRSTNFASVPMSSVQSCLSASLQSSSSCMSSLSSATACSLPNTPRHAVHPTVNAQHYHKKRLITGGSSSPLVAQLAAELDSLAPAYYQSKSPPYHSGSLGRGKSPSSTSSRKGRPESGGESSVASVELRSGSYNKAPKGLKSWLRKNAKTKQRSTSAPNLVESDDESSSCSRKLSSNDSRMTSTRATLNTEKKQSSLKNLFGKLRRTNSQELYDDLGDGSTFKRGNKVRATAGPRLEWRNPAVDLRPTRAVPLRPSYEVFCRWPPELLGDWLTELGLNMYVADCKRNIRSGRHLVNCRSQDLERELGIKNPLHRKKLCVYIKQIEQGKPDPAERLDYHQVLRWLDDVGLPQYRDAFAEARIDGLVLDQLQVQDLLDMKITSAMHHASLARGIQLLRVIGFSMSRLQRKFVADEAFKSGSDPRQVQLWTQHCVSEWLRSIDLTEFTPNLMCAGIHGALLVLEPMVTAESLACVLQIPAQKTLLRRHLSTHFTQLMGPDVIAGKRDFLSDPCYQHLKPSLRIKPLRKGFSLTKKGKSKLEIYSDPDDYLCAPFAFLPPELHTTSTDTAAVVAQHFAESQQRNSRGSRSSADSDLQLPSDLLKLTNTGMLLRTAASSNV